MKTANVLINQNCTAKLCDFGLARSVAGLKTGVELLFDFAGESPREHIRHQNPLKRKP